VSGLTQLVGSFLGECIIRQYQGEWITGDESRSVRIAADGAVDPFSMFERCLKYRSVYCVAEFFSAVPAIAKVRTGGLYAAQNKDHVFRIYKVLAVDPMAVHMRKYSNRFDACPAHLDPASFDNSMDMGSWLEKGTRAEELPIGHFPLAHEGFWAMAPQLIQVEPVTDDELDGYRVWLEAHSSETQSPSLSITQRSSTC
jgi:hypothetical protein